MESDLEVMLRELNGLEFDPHMPHEDYMERCERLEEIAEGIAESPYGRKYDILRNLMCSYEGQDFPTDAVIEAAFETEKGVDFLKEIVDEYSPGDPLGNIIVGDTSLEITPSHMTFYAYERINQFLEVEMHQTDDEFEGYYDDPDVIDKVADGIVDDFMEGKYPSASELDGVPAGHTPKASPEQLSDKVCDAKIVFHDVLPSNVLDAIDDEVSLENIYQTACNDLFFYGSIADMPSDIKKRNATILYHGALEEMEHFYPVFEEVAREMHYEFDARDLGESFGLLLDEIMRYGK